MSKTLKARLDDLEARLAPRSDRDLPRFLAQISAHLKLLYPVEGDPPSRLLGVKSWEEFNNYIKRTLDRVYNKSEVASKQMPPSGTCLPTMPGPAVSGPAGSGPVDEGELKRSLDRFKVIRKKAKNDTES